MKRLRKLSRLCKPLVTEDRPTSSSSPSSPPAGASEASSPAGASAGGATSSSPEGASAGGSTFLPMSLSPHRPQPSVRLSSNVRDKNKPSLLIAINLLHRMCVARPENADGPAGRCPTMDRSPVVERVKLYPKDKSQPSTCVDASACADGLRPRRWAPSRRLFQTRLSPDPYQS